jgi:hypothetical protein
VLRLPLAASLLPQPPAFRVESGAAQEEAAQAAVAAASSYYASVRAALGAPRAVGVKEARARVPRCCADVRLRPGAARAGERRAAASTHSAGCVAAFEVLCVGVASLMVAMQANVTGPEPDAAPACPGVLPHGAAAACDGRAAWDAWAVAELCAGGEDVVGKTTFPQYLVLGAPALAVCLLVCSMAAAGLTLRRAPPPHSAHPAA